MSVNSIVILIYSIKHKNQFLSFRRQYDRNSDQKEYRKDICGRAG